LRRITSEDLHISFLSLPYHETMRTDCNLLLKSIRRGVLLLDRHGYIKYANPAASRLTGYDEEELSGKPVALVYADPSDTTVSEYELEQALKEGYFFSEGWKGRKNGDRYWGELELVPMRDEQQLFVGYSCLLTDTSERKQKELKLRQNAEKFRLMVESVRDYCIFMLDAEGHIVTWNEGAKRVKGYHFSEVVGRHFSIFYTSPDLEDGKPARELKIATETGKYEEEGWRVKKDGSVFWAHVVITALFNEQNKLIGFSKVTRDLSEKREQEERLRQSEERYRLLVEQVTDYGIFMMDEKGRIISWNAGAQKIKGYKPEEIIGKYFSIFYPEEDLIKDKPEEGWRLRKDGSRFWANVVITSVYNSRGTLIGFSKVTRDLTERKAAEKALRHSHDNYRMLADKLQKTNEELTAANGELEQFTSIVSHDLQEPVRTIKSFLELIELSLETATAEELRTYIGKSIRAANRMRELILNLLQYSQLSRTDIMKSEVKVDDIFNEALQNLKSSIEVSGAQITINNEADTIYGDRIQLVQLVQNLLSNALKFTTSKKPEIGISCTVENGNVKFSITDNGIGMAEADINKVFEIFRRLHTQQNYPGTGIGLAICKKIVERHHGQIWPESKQGVGTTFHVMLNEEKNRRLALS
jgi:PAS domain S-box-containing protein